MKLELTLEIKDGTSKCIEATDIRGAEHLEAVLERLFKIAKDEFPRYIHKHER